MKNSHAPSPYMCHRPKWPVHIHLLEDIIRLEGWKVKETWKIINKV